MRLAAQRQQQTNQTNLKLPVNHQQIIPTRDKMKFNWRANWEILLVFVIIIVGIVITTIAAIRSKDKHSLVAQDESTADYGGGISADLSSSLQVPALPQTDFQMQTGPKADASSGVQLEGAEDATVPAAASTRRPPRSGTSAQTPAGHRGDRKRSHPVQSPSGDLRPPVNGAEAIVGLPPKTNQHFNSPNRQHSAASHHNNYMTTASGVGRPSMQLSQHDNYEAMSTEQTPSLSGDEKSSSESKTNASQQQANPKQVPPENRRHAAESKQQRNLKEQADSQGLLGDFNDQLEAQQLEGAGGGGGQKSRPSHHHQQNNNQPTTMQGPYELQPDQQAGGNPANRNSHMKFAHQPEAHTIKIEQVPSALSSPQPQQQQHQPPPPMLDSDEMMTSYTRVPQNQLNLTENTLRGDYSSYASKNNTSSSSMAAAGASETNSDDDQHSSAPDYNGQLGSTSGSTLLGSLHHRAYSGLPFAMLLNDLMKLSRPQTLVDSQAGQLEQPANSQRPQYGILQQLRSLPSPLLALFQQASGSATVGQASDLHGHQLANHDTSESMDHYHRIPMTPYNELNSAMARSLRSTNPLPAFPPPRGVPQTWVPMNMGGVSMLQEASSNADFVASEAAGFVRGATIANGGGMQLAASNLNQQEPMASESNTNQNYQAINSQPNNDATMQSGQPQQVNPTVNQQQQPPTNVPATNQNNNNNNNMQNNNMQSQTGPLFGASAQQAAGSMHISPAQATSEIAQSHVHVPSPLPASSMAHNQAASPVQQSRMQYINQNTMQQQQLSLLQRSDGSGSLRMLGGGSAGGVQQNSVGSQMLTNVANLQSSAAGPKHQMGQQPRLDMSQRAASNVGGSQPIQLNAINRFRRSIEGESSRGDADDDEEEYVDSAPLSIVSPDGRPMSGDVRIMRAHRPQSPPSKGTLARDENKPTIETASSQRQVNHADLNDSALHHYVSHEGPSQGSAKMNKSARMSKAARRKQLMSGDRMRPARDETDDDQEPAPETTIVAGARKSNSKQDLERASSSNNDRRRAYQKKLLDQKSKIKRKKLAGGGGGSGGLQLDAAGSGLMSKLLGVASTNDELEDDMDGDDDESANERRKEELEDAEFGIVNDDRTSGPSSSSEGSTSSNDIGDGGGGSQDNLDVNHLTQDVPSHTNSQEARSADLPIGSAGTTDSNAYARRNQQQQQRSDVEFYGHPGEETRQLKYGILGSGNYEVVNGGIYQDIDESTAAVNSVANYARKPSVLLAGLPKLMGATGSPEEGRHVGGFMRGASAAGPGEMIGLFPSHPSEAYSKMAGLTNPLLDVLDAAHVAGGGGGETGGYFDPNLVTQLGSSGTSARTTHASREQDNSNADDDDLDGSRQNNIDQDERQANDGHQLAKQKRRHKHKQQHQSNAIKAHLGSPTGNYNDDLDLNDKSKASSGTTRAHNKNEPMTTMETLNDANNRIRSSNTNDVQQTPPVRKVNQFYSYHILPSKKVTIFSEQDLDSAPSDQGMRRSYPARPAPAVV